MVVMEPIPGQETHNAEVLKSHNAAFFMHEPRQIQLILKSIFENPKLMENKRRQIQELAKPKAARDLVEFVVKEYQGASS